MIVGFAGAALLVSGGIGSGGFSGAALSGFLLLQVGMMRGRPARSISAGSRWSAHPIVMGAVQQLFGGLAVLPLALFAGSHHIAWSVRGISALFYLVTFGSIVGYSAYAYALDRLPVAVVSIYPYVNSVVAGRSGLAVLSRAFWRARGGGHARDLRRRGGGQVAKRKERAGEDGSRSVDVPNQTRILLVW